MTHPARFGRLNTRGAPVRWLAFLLVTAGSLSLVLRSGTLTEAPVAAAAERDIGRAQFEAPEATNAPPQILSMLPGAMPLLLPAVSEELAGADPIAEPGPRSRSFIEPDAAQGERLNSEFATDDWSKPLYPKLGGGLSQVVEGQSSDGLHALGLAPETSGAAVAVSIYFDADDNETVGTIKQAQDVIVANEGVGVIEAYAGSLGLVSLNLMSGVIAVRPLADSISKGVTSEATRASVHNSKNWNDYGFLGAGVKVGIIDRFDGYAGLMGEELPQPSGVRCYSGISAFSSNLADCRGSEHGTAVAEAVVDIAPAVDLYLANPNCGLDLIATARWMVSEGVQVINFSRACPWTGPGDGTSIFNDSPLIAVDVAADGGAIWVGAAGNEASATWSGNFSDDDRDGFPTFGSACGEENTFWANAGDRVNVLLRWDDSWGTANRDLDVRIWAPFGGRSVGLGGIDYQDGSAGSVPLETLSYVAEESGVHRLQVKQLSGSRPSWLDVQLFTSQDLMCSTSGHSIGSPGDSRQAGSLSVGAASWETPGTIEPFSSQGPTRDNRIKPDIVGADGANSAIYGPWFGTSEAAPHVAGLAALIQEAYPGDTPANVADRLKGWANPRGVVVPNNVWGYGLATLPKIEGQLAFLESPSDGQVGEEFLVQPVVSMVDYRGQTLSVDNSTVVTLVVVGADGGALECAGGTSKKVSNGIARFSGCRVNRITSDLKLFAQPDCFCKAAWSDSFTISGVGGPPLPKVRRPDNGPLPTGTGVPALVVQNAGVTAADIRVDYFRWDSTKVTDAGRTFSGVGHDSSRIASDASNPSLPVPFDGYATGYSERNSTAAIRVLDIDGPGATDDHSFSAVTIPPKGSPKVALPMLLSDLGPLHWNSRITVRNVGSEVACLRASYFITRSLTDVPVGSEIVDSGAGEPTCPTGYRLPPGMQMVFGGGEWADHPFPGAARNTQSGGVLEVINANGRNDIVAYADLYRSDGNRLFGSYDGFSVRPSDPETDDVGTEVIVPLAIKWISGWYTVIGAQNLGNNPADINIRYIGKTQEGEPVDVTVTLPAVENVGFHSTYDQSTALPINFVGYAVVKSSQPVAALVVRGKQTSYLSGVNEPTYTAVNGTPRQNGQGEWYLPLIYRRYEKVTADSIGWNSWIQVQVADGGEAVVTLRFVGTPGSDCAPGPFETSGVVAGSKVFYMNADVDNGFPTAEVPECFRGAAHILSTRPVIVIANVSSDSFPGGDNEALYNGIAKSRAVGPIAPGQTPQPTATSTATARPSISPSPAGTPTKTSIPTATSTAVSTATRSPSPTPTRTLTPPSGGAITVQNATWRRDSFGAIYIQGEVVNGLGRPVSLVRLEGRYFQGSELLATEIGWASPDTIPAGGTGIFFIALYDAPARITSTSVSVDNFFEVPPGQPPVVGLTASGVSSYVDGIGWAHVTGNVTNSSSTTYSNVLVLVAFYNPAGEVVEVGIGFVSPGTLSPGQTGTFEALGDKPGDLGATAYGWVVDGDYP